MTTKPKTNPAVNKSQPVVANKPVTNKLVAVTKPVTAKPAAKKAPAQTTATKVAPPAAANKPLATTPVNKVANPKKGDKKSVKKEPKKEDKKPKVEKIKMERDSFTMPKEEYAQIALLKARLTGMGHPVKKSELLRAGIKLLAAMTDSTLKASLEKVPTIKTGRPKK